MYDNMKGRSATASLALATNPRTKFDEFLRRQLGVSDAKDPVMVVSALRKLFPDTAARLDEERRGVSIGFAAPPQSVALPPVASGMASPAQMRLQEVQQALEADLTCLMDHPANRDYRAPLSGWHDAARAELGEGVDAAYRAADPALRDRTFYSVRKLGDYARVARMAGLLNPVLTPEFRRLAATMDEAAIVLRVLAGEALFRAGFDAGGTVFQVAYEDMRQRGEQLVEALEVFTASSRSTASSHEGTNDWGDGKASYGALQSLLGKGNSDLKAIVRPEGMQRLLAVLLDSVSGQEPGNLRGIAATVPIELIQLRRLQAAASSLLNGKTRYTRVPQSSSGPLSMLVQALNLFIEAFADPGSGSRLLSLAQPAPLAALDMVRADAGRSTVMMLFHLRVVLATRLDAVYADPDFDPLKREHPALLDSILYGVDRAIDLYLAGSASDLSGPEEGRARAYEEIIRRWLEGKIPGDPGLRFEAPPTKPRHTASIEQEVWIELHQVLLALVGELGKAKQRPSKNELEVILQEHRIQEAEWGRLAVQLTQVAPERRRLLESAARLYTSKKKKEEVEKDDQAYVGVPAVPADSRISTDLIARTSEKLVKEVARTRRALKSSSHAGNGASHPNDPAAPAPAPAPGKP